MPTLQTTRYIFYDIPIKFRIALTKLRCYVHKLHVEGVIEILTMKNDCVSYVIRIT